MPSTRELRRRIKSVKSIRQITKAMELVSAAKMRKASEATLGSRPYALRMQYIIQDIIRRSEGDKAVKVHPLMQERAVEHLLCVVISSDRGLAGSYDSSILKKTLQFTREQEALGRKVSFVTIGRRVEAGLLRQGHKVVQSIAHSSTHPTTQDILPLATFAQNAYVKGTYDQVVVIYTNFRSMLVQEATVFSLLPFKLQLEPESTNFANEFIYEPNPQEVLDGLLPRLFEAELFQGLQESLASEHSARRLAMKNASDNASDVIEDYTLTYNSIRQSAITQEIAEITSGAAALA